MASSSGGPSGVHYALIFFVALSLILGILSYLNYREMTKARNDLTAATERANTADAALNKATSEIEAIKDKLGIQFESVGVGDPNPNTVLGKLEQDLVNLGREENQQTVAATLNSMRRRLDQLAQENANLEKTIQSDTDRILSLETTYQNRVDEVSRSQDESEQLVQSKIAELEEIVAEKEQEISRWRSDFQREQVDKETLKDQLARARRDFEGQLARLESQNTLLSEELQEVRRVSFERADGQIRTVDSSTGYVWINLGREDNLNPQTTFSVYKKNNSGIGRGLEDVKGKIEVVELLGPHLAQARIIEQDNFNPITPGDPIYSPVFSAGRPELFSLIGRMDIDGDGTDDRALLRSIINNAGGGIELEVDTEGNRIPENGRLTDDTRFLVIGDIPEPTDFPSNSPDALRAEKLQSLRTELIREARLNGVTRIDLREFLAYLGYKPQQRTFRPGASGQQYNLRSGSQSSGVDGNLRNRESSGQTSELFRRFRSGSNN